MAITVLGELSFAMIENDDKGVWIEFLKRFIDFITTGWGDLAFGNKYPDLYHSDEHKKVTRAYMKVCMADSDANSVEIKKLREFADALEKLK